MASKRRDMFYKNKKQEATEIETTVVVVTTEVGSWFPFFGCTSMSILARFPFKRTRERLTEDAITRAPGGDGELTAGPYHFNAFFWRRSHSLARLPHHSSTR
ncbi:hypothetical protein AAG570_002433 [Ranatra chinensis]|uniref:Uncharacterized protein n=1 Tax=Ranatra chinensis TaxID=642074 RepID=A0ABD0Y7I2_9HEMI